MGNQKVERREDAPKMWQWTVGKEWESTGWKSWNEASIQPRTVWPMEMLMEANYVPVSMKKIMHLSIVRRTLDPRERYVTVRYVIHGHDAPLRHKNEAPLNVFDALILRFLTHPFPDIERCTIDIDAPISATLTDQISCNLTHLGTFLPGHDTPLRHHSQGS